jgi:hypothetical protein
MSRAGSQKVPPMFTGPGELSALPWLDICLWPHRTLILHTANPALVDREFRPEKGVV